MVTWAAFLGNQVEDLYSSRALLNEFFTEGTILQELCHHQTGPAKIPPNSCDSSLIYSNMSHNHSLNIGITCKVDS